MKKIFLLFIVQCCLAWPSGLYAQNKIADSLSLLLEKSSSLAQKGRLHIKLGKEYIYVDTGIAKSNFEKGFVFANDAADDMGKGMYHLYSAYMLCDKANFNEGLLEFDKVSVLLEKFLSSKSITVAEKDESNGYLLDAELSRGNVYLELYEYDKAIDMFWKVLALMNKTNFPDKDNGITSVYHSIALAYYHQAQYQTALKYYLQSYPYSEKGGNDNLKAHTNIYIGMCYNLLNKYDSAAIYLKKAEQFAITSNDANLKTMFYARSAELERKSERYLKAVSLYDSAISYASVTGNTYQKATFSIGKATCLLNLNRLEEARQTALTAYSFAQAIDKKREILEAQKILADIEGAAGNYKAAYSYMQQYRSGNDSLHTEELIEKMQVLDKKYQSQLKEEKIAQLQKDAELQQLKIKKKNLINYLLTGAAVVLILVSYLLYRNYSQKQKLQQHRINELETEKKLTATEAVLKGEEKERTRMAKDLHDGLGGMLSGIKYSFNNMKGNLVMTPDNAQAFERSMDMLDSSIKEMRRVAHNMMPEALVKFGLNTALKDFCNDINLSGALQTTYQSIGLANENVEQTTAIAIYRIVQELINNTMKHAAAQSAIVQVSKTDNTITITVEDDGKGFNTSFLEGTKGIGWSNIQSRVEYLKGKLDVQSAPGKGTSVHIELNV